MTFSRIVRVATLGLVLIATAGCSALSSIQTASAPLDTFELSPLPAGTVVASRSRRSLEVALPTATGALNSESIVIKPTALHVQALPDARWVNESTEHVQLLLVRSLAGSGRYSLVSSAGTGPSPDYVLLTDLQSFQAEIEMEQANVVIRMTLTLLRDVDGSVLSSRTFTSTATAPDTSTENIVAAFDRAMTQQLTDVVGWIVKGART